MTKTKQVIVFGTDAQVRGIGGILAKNGVEVVGVSSMDSYQPLIAVVRKYRDTGLVLLCGTPLNNNVLYATQEVRRLTKSPILVVMSQCRITTPSKEKVFQAGATEVLHSPNHIEDEQVVMAAVRMLGISLRLERKEELSPLPRVVPQQPLRQPPTLALVPLSQTAPETVVRPAAEPAQAETAQALKPTPFVPAQSMDETAATMLDLAVRLETNAKLLREWAEEMLASTKRQQGQAPQSENVLVDHLLIGQMVAKGHAVTFCGKTFHLSHQQAKMLDILCQNHGNGGADKERFKEIGIKTPGTVAVVMSGLRKTLAQHLLGAGISCQGGKYRLELPSR